MTDLTDQTETAVRSVIARWWSRLSRWWRLALVALPILGTLGGAVLAAHGVRADVYRHSTEIQTLQLDVARLGAEGAGRAAVLVELRQETSTLAESVSALREVTARLSGGVDALLRYVDREARHD